MEYPKGTRWRVIAEGVKWTGLKPEPGGYRGAGGDVPVGTIVTSKGYGPGWGGDPGYGYHWEVPGAEGVGWVELSPSTGGPFSFQPAAGLLEEVS